MTWIYNNNIAKPIEDNDPFNTPTGKYPGNWDKSSFARMVKVVETAREAEFAALRAQVQS